MNISSIHGVHLDDHQPRWFAVHTRYKREKVILRRLEQKGIRTYLPLRRHTRRYNRKVSVVELPVISGYIFTCITRKQYVPVLDTPDVVDFVKFARDPVAIPDQEMQLLQRVVEEGVEVEAEPKGYRVGDEVEITSGNLAGVRGILLRCDNDKNFLLELSQIGYSLRMQVDPMLLRRRGRAGG